MNNNDNNNSALINKWRFYIPDDQDCTNFVECVQAVSTPNFQIEPASVSTNQLVRGNQVGTNFMFTPVTVRFKIDESWESYAEIYRWMVGMVNYKTGSSTRNIGENRTPQSIILYMLDAEGDKIVQQIRLHEAWPSELSEIELSYTESNAMEIICNAVFLYNYAELLDKNGDPYGEAPKGGFSLGNGQ